MRIEAGTNFLEALSGTLSGTIIMSAKSVFMVTESCKSESISALLYFILQKGESIF